MPMEDIDKNEVSDEGISDDEDLMMREVVQGDADLFFLHHYLSERKSSPECFLRRPGKNRSL